MTNEGLILSCVCLMFHVAVAGSSHNLLIYQDFLHISTQLIIPALSVIPNNPTTTGSCILYFILQIRPRHNQGGLNRVICIFIGID